MLLLLLVIVEVIVVVVAVVMVVVWLGVMSGDDGGFGYCCGGLCYDGN